MSNRLTRRVVPPFLIALVSASCTVAGDTDPASRVTELARDLAVVPPESVGLATDRLERLESGMQAFVDDGKLASVVTLAARHGKIVHFSAAGVIRSATTSRYSTAISRSSPTADIIQ